MEAGSYGELPNIDRFRAASEWKPVKSVNPMARLLSEVTLRSDFRGNRRLSTQAEMTMTAIGKRKRDEAVGWISEYTKACFTHVGIVSHDTYRRAFFTDAEVELIQQAKKLVDIDSNQRQLLFGGMAVGHDLFKNPIPSDSPFWFQGAMPMPAWSKDNIVRDDFVFHKIERAAFEVLQMAVDVGVFNFAAKRSLALATTWEDLGANFPPFVAIANKAREPDIAACMTAAKTIKPLHLQVHERAAVKYALNWAAVQNMIGGFTSARVPSDSFRIYKNSTTLQSVTFAGNEVTMQFTY